MDIYLKKTVTGFVVMPESEEDVKKIKFNEIRKFKVTKQRNLQFHRKYFKMLSLVLENTDTSKLHAPKTTDDLLLIVKHYLKMYDEVVVNNEIIKKYHSISFDKMDQFKFEKLYSNTLDILSLLLDMNEQDKENFVIELLNNFM